MGLMLLISSILLGLAALPYPGVLAQFNQECYFAKNQRAGSAIIPCLDPSKGVSPCCQNGDICLSDLSCWSPKTGVTYQYGCTDSSFEDDNCPKKCGLDPEKSNWIGLIYCNDTTNMWACNHPDVCGNCPNNTVWDPAIQPIPDNPRHCQDLKTIKAAFAGPVSLMPSLSLPSDGGSSTLYFSPTGSTFIPVTGYIPAWAEKKSSSSGGGLGSGAKIGIAVGVAVGAMIVLITAIVLILRRRYRRKGAEAPPVLYGGDAKSELPADNEVHSPFHEMDSPNSGTLFLPYHLRTPQNQEPGTPRELNEAEAQIYEMPARRESQGESPHVTMPPQEMSDRRPSRQEAPSDTEIRYELSARRESRYELADRRDSK